jgi:hypothetical protein
MFVASLKIRALLKKPDWAMLHYAYLILGEQLRIFIYLVTII